MFQKLLLTIFATIIGIIWYRFIFKRDNRPNKLDSSTANKSTKFDNQQQDNIEMLEPCSNCGVYFTSDGRVKTCPNCSSK